MRSPKPPGARGREAELAAEIGRLRARLAQAEAAGPGGYHDENLQFALDAAQVVGAWTWDIASDRVHADERFARLYSVDPTRAASGAPMAEFIAGIHPEDRERVSLKIRQAVAEAGEFAAEYRLVQRDGSVRWVLARGRAYHDEAGTPVRFPGITVDITERKRVEEALRGSEERLRIAQRAGGVGTFEWYPGAGKFDVSDEFRRIWGIAPDVAVTDALLVGLFHPDDRTLSAPARLASENPLEYVEYRITRPDTGEERWIARRGEVVPDDPGGGGGKRGRRFLGVAFDITERKRAEEALRTSEERFRRFSEATRDGVLIHDGAEVFDCNDAFTRMFGYAGTEDVVGRDPGSFVTTQSLPLLRERHESHDERPYDVEAQRQDGSTFPAQFLGREVDWEGRAVRVGLIRDLTEERRAQASLLEERARLDAVVRHMPVGVILVEAPSGRLIAANRQVGRIWRVRPGERASFVDHDVYRGFHPDGRPYEAHEWPLARAIATGKPVENEEIGFARCDGTCGVMSASSAPIRDAAGRIVAAVVTFGDVTARKQAEADLRRLNTELETMVEERTRERDRLWDLSEDLLVVADYEGRLLRVSPSWTKLLGHDEQALLTRPYDEIVHPDDFAAVMTALLAMRSSGRSISFEDRVLAADGTWRWVDWTLSPEPGGERMTGVGRDMTAAKARQAELETAQEQLRQSQKMEAVGQLTGGLAHDFNNLLTGIVGSLELMQTRIAQGRTGEIGRYIGAASQSASRAAALTHRLLAFSRRQTLDPKPTDANKLVAGMEDLIRRTIGPAIHLETVLSGGIWRTLCDPNQLESALLNLAINARDAMPDGGRLTIETANAHLDDAYAAAQRDVTPGQYVAICISDTGVGMGAEVIERAFEPFFTTKPTGLGTGLGLSMVYGFVKQSNGHVRLYSEPGQGTTVKLYLPRYWGESQAGATARGVAEADRAAPGETVLVVDDEAVVRMLIVEVLGELDYAAIEAADGAQGLEILQSTQRIDLLITDVGLPGGLNGRQLADAARVLRPDLRVLFITGYAENAALGNGYLDRGMQVMTKPFAMDALATKIRTMLAG